MSPRVLVLYYSQSGQLRDILNEVVRELRGKAELTFAEIEPVQPFPFPWPAHAFFDAMPETVAHVPVAIKPLPAAVREAAYDLIILGYQPWYLNPSLPVSSFLQTKDAAALFRNRPVVTVIGCRNMWLHGQEKVKEYLKNMDARLVGNIVLEDRQPNLISVLTVVRWAFRGQKEASRWLPAAGVQEADIRAAARFGKPLIARLASGDFSGLQDELLALDAIRLRGGLVLLEQRGIRNFRKWSAFIRAKGGPGNPARAGRVRRFRWLLTIAIFILSPLSGLSAAIRQQLSRKRLAADVAYFRQIAYEPGRL